MRAIVTFAVFALAAGVIVPRYAAQPHAAHPASPPAPALLTARPQALAPSAAYSHAVVIQPSRGGHFRVEGSVNGRRMNFMVDTGASMIALTERDAAMLGFHPGARDYLASVNTANGTVRAAPVVLDLVEIDDVLVRNVAAVVLPDSALSDNLLGMTFLSRLRHFEYTDGKLVLEQ